MVERCKWARGSQVMIDYHDAEWGVPIHDDCTLFEFLILEGAQAGLSWSTILNKRQEYRRAYDNFDVEKIARYRDKEVEKLLANPGIVRNKRKVFASINNAQAFLKVQSQFGSFDSYVWQFVGGIQKQNAWNDANQIPATTKESEAMSRNLSERGFEFVGATICYAFMQAVGMVNDHTVGCFRYGQVCSVAVTGGKR